MIAPRTLAERLAAARLATLADAIVATLRPLFPDVTVRTHPGRIDVADVIAADIFLPPMIAIAVIDGQPDLATAGHFDFTPELAAYVVTEDMAIGDRSTPRDQVAIAIGVGIVEILAGLDTPQRWGLSNIGGPYAIRLRPLFTALTFEKGSAFYAVTWRQKLFAEGEPMPGPVPTERLETIEDGKPVVLWPEPEDAP